MPALAAWCDRNGVLYQIPASLGAWMYMVIPPELREAVNTGYEAWRKGPRDEPSLPAELPPLLADVMGAIYRACAEHAGRRLGEAGRPECDTSMAPYGKAATIGEAAERAAVETTRKIGARPPASRQADSKGRDKARGSA